MKTKKTFRIIRLFFKKLYKLFDSKVILPITKFFVKIGSRFKINGYGFEKIISRKNGLVVIALLASVLVFIFVDTRSASLAETSAEIIYNQPIKAIYNDAAYVVEGLPEAVDVTLIGTRSELYLAKQLPMNDIEVDLRGLKPGVHKVNLKYKKATNTVDYKLDPSIATVIIYDKVSESKLINTEIINKDKIDSKLIIDEVKLKRDQVYVKGNKEKISQVASVKALVNLANIVNEAAGEQLLKDIKLVAYDIEGKVIDVEIVPSKIDATITIISPSKVVPIKVIPSGELVFGKSISKITTNINAVTIYGKQSILDGIIYIPVTIDVAGLKDNKEYNMNITKPVGVNSISDKRININITLGEESSKEIRDLPLEYINLAEGYSVQAVGVSNTKVSIIAKGVSEVINSLNTSDIKAFVDLKDLKVGVQDVKVQVTGEDLRVKYIPELTKVTLRIYKK